MKYKENFNILNEILSEWNPIGVPYDVSKNEYTSYIPNLFKYENNFLELVDYLEFLITEEIGLNYNEKNIEEKKDLVFYAYKLYVVMYQS